MMTETSSGHATGQPVLQPLAAAECLGLLEPGGVGRIGFASTSGIVIVPVNFAVTANTIIFRTAPDTLIAVHATTRLSFQADHIDHALRQGWSVLVQGHARKITSEAEIRHLEITTGLQPWADGARDVWFRLTPGRISGRIIQPR